MSPAAILHGLLLVVLLVACTSPPPIIGNPAQEAAKRDLNLLNARVIHAYQEREEARKRVEFFKRQLAQRGLSAKERAGIQVDLEEAQARLQASTDHVAELEAALAEEHRRYRAAYGDGPRAAGMEAVPRPSSPVRSRQ